MAQSFISPRTSKFTAASLIAWSDGTLFDGYMAIGLAFPTFSGQNASFITKGQGSNPPQQIPQWCKVPIFAGVFDQATELWYNSDIDPPNTQYVAYFFDNSDRLIAPAAGTAPFFTITGSPTTITVPTLTSPLVAVTSPTPEL